MRLNKKQKGLLYGVVLWMFFRIFYLPFVGSKSLVDISELMKTAGVMFFGLLLVYLVKDNVTK